ncbi:MAG TPA: sensor domain-containing protein [Trebonia sp.]
MAGPVTVTLAGILREPFTKRTWKEIGYTLVSLPLAVFALVFIIPMLHNGFFMAASASGARKFADRSRFLAWKMLGERVPAPPPLRSRTHLRVETPDAPRFSVAVGNAGGRVRQWAFSYGSGIDVIDMPESQVTELAAQEGVQITGLRQRPFMAWLGTRIRDKHSWRARAYFGLKLPLAALGLAVVAGLGLGGLYFLLFPAWWALGLRADAAANLAEAFRLVPLGAVMLLAAPWLLRGTTQPDRWLIRTLLGPGSAERVRELEETRTIAVDDAAARLRSIERDLHDGAQAQLVAVAMKLGLAKDKLADTGAVDLARITQLVDDAHSTAVEAIAELRTIVRGIHPPVLDKGLADALATLANRSVVPVELVTDIPERPTDAIETIAYFSAAELIANVSKHSGARHATLEAVHVPGLLRIRVTDDGHGGARPVADGGLRGLAERVRTVDGHLDIDSPPGGPTTVTVELPSRA